MNALWVLYFIYAVLAVFVATVVAAAIMIARRHDRLRIKKGKECDFLAGMTPEERRLLDEVRQFVADQTKAPFESILPYTTLVDDLGVDLGYAKRMMRDFGERFGVDMSGLDMERHFGVEDVYIPHVFPRVIFRGLVHEWRERRDDTRSHPDLITVSDLVTAASRGFWSCDNEEPGKKDSDSSSALGRKTEPGPHGAWGA